MLILFSPTKQMDISRSDKYENRLCRPRFQKEAATLNRELQQYNKKELMDLMKISEKLSENTYREIHRFRRKKHFRSALYTYSGTTYQWIQTADFTPSDLDFASEHVRILSGLYGILEPFDEICEYRLEMKTPLKVGDFENLTQFWKQKITDVLVSENKTIINLASAEYTKAIDKKQLPQDFISLQFKEREGTGIRTVGMYSKMARGMMADRMIRERIENPQDIKQWNLHGYLYNDTLSSDLEWVFVNDRS